MPTVRPNPKKLNALQLRTLAILQAIARRPDLAGPPEQDGHEGGAGRSEVRSRGQEQA